MLRVADTDNIFQTLTYLDFFSLSRCATAVTRTIFISTLRCYISITQHHRKDQTRTPHQTLNLYLSFFFCFVFGSRKTLYIFSFFIIIIKARDKSALNTQKQQMLDDEIIYHEARCCSTKRRKKKMQFFFYHFLGGVWGFSVSSVGRRLIQSQIKKWK